MAARKKAIRAHSFKHQEVVGLLERANSESISLEQPLVCVMEQSQEIQGHSNINVATTSSIPTLIANKKGPREHMFKWRGWMLILILQEKNIKLSQ